MATPGVDFFRIDRSGSTRGLLVTGTVLVAIGASLIGAHLVHRLGEGESHFMSLLGGLALAAGLILTFGALAMMLFENVYLSIHDEHLLLHENGKETTIAWADLTSVEVDAKNGALVLGRANAAEVRWFSGKAAKELKAKIDEARRKAPYGLLRTGSTSDPPRPSVASPRGDATK